MARGIDSAAHRGALSSDSRTIAVYGTGLGNVFPAENKELAGIISKSGACVSELGMNYEARAENFPARNRIISGMSLATIVIEASLRSGALITAQSAVDQNREVMAVPGKIDSPLSTGCHLLIKQGARLVDRVEDVVDALGYITENIQQHVSDEAQRAAQEVEAGLFSADMLNLSENEKSILKVLGTEPLHVDEVMGMVDLFPGKINASMVSLRLKGLIRQHPGNMFSRKNNIC
jgi:DNA processing protein